MSVNVIDDSIPSETAVRNIKDIISSAPKCCDEKDTESQDQEQDMDEQEEMSGDKIKDDDSVDDDDQEEQQLGLGEDFMREIILKKVRVDFPAKFGREPTEEELESYVSGTIQAAGALFGFGSGENEEAEDADEEDADYDPNEDEQQKVADEKEDLADEHDLEQELADEADEEDADYDPKEDEPQQVADEEEDLIDADELEDELENDIDEPLGDVDEKELVNSQEFENELRAAIENVQHIAKLDKEKILSMARQEYLNDTGEEATQQMVAAAFKMFAIDEDENENEIEEKNADIEAAEDAELTAEAAEDAELFEKEFGEALENVRELGQTHQKNLVDKICQTFGELHGKQPTPEEMCGIFARIQSKLAEEAMEDFIDNNNASDDVENDSDYEPNEEELKQVAEDKEIEVLEDIVTQTEENEEAEANTSGDDEDYLPEKDTEDYSKDIEDDIDDEFENENAIKGSDENEDTSNINID